MKRAGEPALNEPRTVSGCRNGTVELCSHDNFAINAPENPPTSIPKLQSGLLITDITVVEARSHSWNSGQTSEESAT